jgi:F-type H+-transporting ATPase subunit delta
MSKNVVAHTYARAIFSLTCDGDDAKFWVRFLQDLTKLCAIEQMQLLLKSNRTNDCQKIEIIQEALDIKNDQFINFLKVVFLNKRIDIVDVIYHAFLDIINAKNNVTNVVVQSAFKLDDKELDNIKNAINKKTGKDCHISQLVNSGLVGGIVIKIGDNIIDGSILGQIKQLSSQLKL